MSRKLVSCISAFILIVVLHPDVIAQTTIANANGSWALGSNWVGGTAPGFTGLGSTSITVNSTWPNYLQVGAYGSNQNLTFAANNDSRSITVNGILVVYGNVDFANMAMDLVIPSGGVVIILGDLDMNNKIDLSLGGTLVVKGDFGKTGSQGSFTGTGGVYAGSYSGNASSLIPPSNEFLVNPDLINNPSLQYIEDFLNSNGQFPLPVELTSFIAQQSGEMISLKWSTASELNFDYFSVEHSVNGINFKEIGQVKGHGTTKEKQDYHFDDNLPCLGKNYYRLKSVDFDGQVEYFGVVMEDYSGRKVFSVYPNPSDGVTLSYTMNFSPDENSTIIVYDNLGMIIASTSSVGQGNSLTFLNPLNQGAYFVKIVSNSFTQIERFIVR